MAYTFLAFISRMKYINRWSLMRNTIPENIQEHSLHVAMIAHILAIIKNLYFEGNVNPDRIAVIGMYHDCNETITGDMPTPIKYMNKDIQQAYKNIEEVAIKKLLSMLPGEMQDIFTGILHPAEDDSWKLVKAADRISAYIKCIEEEKSGNREFRKAAESIFQSIKKIELPEADYFMENFLPSFYKSLDEIEV